MKAFWRDRRISFCMKLEQFSFSFLLPLNDSIRDVLKSLKGWRELSWAHIWMIMKNLLNNLENVLKTFVWKTIFCVKSFSFIYTRTFWKWFLLWTYESGSENNPKSFYVFRISAQKYLNRVLIQHFPFFLVRVSYWSIRKPLLRNFERRHVLEKQLNELSLKHLYKSVSLLNDISRNVQNIDYTRDMSWEEYFWIFWFYIVFVFFENFLFLYFVFVCFSNLYFVFSKIFTAKLFER